MNKNAGFSLVVIIVVVAVIATVGLITWRVYDTNKNNSNSNSQTTNTNQSSNSTNSQTTDLNEGYVVIKEWGVRFKPVEGLNDTEYTIGTVEGANGVASFSTKALSQYGDACSASQAGLAPLGKLMRTQGTKENAMAISTGYAVQVGDYYYQYVTPQTTCSPDDATAASLQTNTLSLFKSAIKTLEASK